MSPDIRPVNGSAAEPEIRVHPERKAHDDAVRDLKFTRVPNEILEAIIADKTATIGERYFAWFLRKSLGNYSLFCIAEPGAYDQPLFEADAAREILPESKSGRQRISEHTKTFVEAGYLELRGVSKLLYPVLAPLSHRLRICPGSPGHFYKSPLFSEFLESEFWNVTHSPDKLFVEEARSMGKRATKVLLSCYKQWRTTRTNAGAYNKEESLESIESPAAAAVVDSPEPVAAAEPKQAEQKQPESSSLPRPEEARTVETSKPLPDKAEPIPDPEVPVLTEGLKKLAGPLVSDRDSALLLRDCRRRAPVNPPVRGQEVLAVCVQKAKNTGEKWREIRNPIGFFLEVIPQYFPGVLKTLRQRRE